ncbi:MAG: DinB family protein [Phycisphaerae bacterium]|nr:DinB family protein [Phycisphaerae bacterium]
MKPDPLIVRLEHFPKALRAAVAVAEASGMLHWKPAPQHWSVLEICCHLRDEEREDFRPRIASTLEAPTRPWSPLNLEGIAETRRYNEQDVATVLNDFERERAASVAWLRSLGAVDWTVAHPHPKAGPVAAGELLASWAAHDALHLRQVARRLYDAAETDGAPYRIVYAGEWR